MVGMPSILSSELVRDLTWECCGSPDKNPVIAYLLSLPDAYTRQQKQKQLSKIADLLLPGTDIFMFNWSALRQPQIAVLQSYLRRHFSAKMVHQYSMTVCHVLKEVWKLRHMTREDYQQVVNLLAPFG
jgi:hypothetical protein